MINVHYGENDNSSVTACTDLRVGVIGCGEHSRDNLLPCLWQIPMVTVVAICDIETPNLMAASRLFPAASIFSDYGELFNQSNLDAIVIAATPQVHYEVSRKAIAKGIHVFVEKPAARTSRELRELAVLAEAAGVVTAIGHNIRHSTAVHEVLRAIRNPAFGGIRSAEVRYFASKPVGDRWGLGSIYESFLLSHVTHAVDLLIHLIGDVSVISSSSVNGSNGDITLASSFTSASNVLGMLFVTSSAPRFSLDVTLVGSNRQIVSLNSLRRVTVVGDNGLGKGWCRGWTPSTLDPGYRRSGYLTELECFVTSAMRPSAQSSRPRPSFMDELAVYAVLDEMRKVERAGRNKTDSSEK